MDAKLREGFRHQESYGMVCMSQDEEDLEIEPREGLKNKTFQVNGGIGPALWMSNMDSEQSAGKTDKRMLHANVENGSECLLETKADE